MLKQQYLELFVDRFESYGYECSLLEEHDCYVCKNISTEDFYVFYIDVINCIQLRNYWSNREEIIEQKSDKFLQYANEFNSNYSIAKCYITDNSQMAAEIIINGDISEPEFREHLTTFKRLVQNLFYKFDDIYDNEMYLLSNKEHIGEPEQNLDETEESVPPEETPMHVIDCAVVLGMNFTIYLVEKILIEFTTDCANEPSYELNDDLQRLVARGLPCDTDIHELQNLFLNIFRGINKINSSDESDFVLRVNLNNEDVIALEFFRNYAPFMDGAWQLKSSSVR